MASDWWQLLKPTDQSSGYAKKLLTDCIQAIYKT